MKEKRRQQGNKQVVKIYNSAAIHFLMWTVYARNEKRNLNSFHGERETEMKETLHNKNILVWVPPITLQLMLLWSS